MACVNRDAEDPIFRTYDYPELVMSIIENVPVLANTSRTALCFSNNDGSADDVVSRPEWTPKVNKIMGGTQLTCPAYLGAYSPEQKDIRLVYAYKVHSKYEDLNDVLSIGLCQYNGGDVGIMVAKYNENTSGIGENGKNACKDGKLTGLSPTFDVTSHEIAFTCDDA